MELQPACVVTTCMQEVGPSNPNKRRKEHTRTGRVVCIYNYKGGVWKTSTAINLGAILARTHKVLLVDADSQCNLTSFFFNSEEDEQDDEDPDDVPPQLQPANAAIPPVGIDNNEPLIHRVSMLNVVHMDETCRHRLASSVLIVKVRCQRVCAKGNKGSSWSKHCRTCAWGSHSPRGQRCHQHCQPPPCQQAGCGRTVIASAKHSFNNCFCAAPSMPQYRLNPNAPPAAPDELLHGFAPRNLYNNMRTVWEPPANNNPSDADLCEAVYEIPGYGGNLLLIPGAYNLGDLETELADLIPIGFTTRTATDPGGQLNFKPRTNRYAGAFRWMLNRIMAAMKVEFVLIDCAPANSNMNKVFAMSSDFILPPLFPDFFSMSSMQGLLFEVLPGWYEWREQVCAYKDLMGAAQ